MEIQSHVDGLHPGNNVACSWDSKSNQSRGEHVWEWTVIRWHAPRLWKALVLGQQGGLFLESEWEWDFSVLEREAPLLQLWFDSEELNIHARCFGSVPCACGTHVQDGQLFFPLFFSLSQGTFFQELGLTPSNHSECRLLKTEGEMSLFHFLSSFWLCSLAFSL